MVIVIDALCQILPCNKIYNKTKVRSLHYYYRHRILCNVYLFSDRSASSVSDSRIASGDWDKQDDEIFEGGNRPAGTLVC